MLFKRIFSLLLGVALFFSLPAGVSAEDKASPAEQYSVTVNGTVTETDGLVIVPAREVGEALGFEVTWLGDDRFTLDDGIMNTTVTWGEDSYLIAPSVGGEEVYNILILGVPPYCDNDLSYVPLKLFEALKGNAAVEITQSAQNEKPGSTDTDSAASAAFADSLIQAAAPEGNWMLSPYSARMCLAMFANGTEGKTKEELLSALNISDLDRFNEYTRELISTYDSYSRIMSLNTANSVWLNQDHFNGVGSFLESFLNTVKTFYNAEAREVTNADSVEQVNEWVNEKTNGKIQSILTEDNRSFLTALVNAVYFKAAWETEFYKNATEPDTFRNIDGTTGKTDFMHVTDDFGYYADDSVQAIKLNYKSTSVDNELGENFQYYDGADFSMYIMKTDESMNVAEFLNNADFTYSLVNASVPKFKVEYGQTLDDALKAMGIKTAYDPVNADVSAMVDTSNLIGDNIYLDTVLQKTYVAIDEEGTEAAAVTAIVVNGTGAVADPPKPVEFKADSPFYFAIRDNTRGEVLFVGRYVQV